MGYKQSKVIVYYDVVSDKFMIRIVDVNFKDIAVLDELPLLSRIVDLQLKVIDVDICITEKGKLIINNEYFFSIGKDNLIKEVQGYNGEVFKVGDETNKALKNIFGFKTPSNVTA